MDRFDFMTQPGELSRNESLGVDLAGTGGGERTDIHPVSEARVYYSSIVKKTNKRELEYSIVW